jgi:hypothetical protein
MPEMDDLRLNPIPTLDRKRSTYSAICDEPKVHVAALDGYTQNARLS